MSVKSIYKTIGKAKTSERGTYFSYITDKDEKGNVTHRAADYLLEILRVKDVDVRPADTAFVVDFKVLESNNPSDPVGEERNFFQKMSSDSAPGEVKKFILAASGVNLSDKAAVAEAEKTMDDDMEDILGPKQLLAGQRVSLRVTHKLTKAGKDFSAHNFRPAGEKAEEE